ncbi:cellulose binding domain-containing protein [Candidatus Gracilibacteria bacterium]|nr:cellulose binding domain-containing protein [Candidatus Gracilibacteria bacterium]
MKYVIKILILLSFLITFITKTDAAFYTMNPVGGTANSNDLRIIIGDWGQTQVYYKGLAQNYGGNPGATGNSGPNHYVRLSIGNTRVGKGGTNWTSATTSGSQNGNTYNATTTLTYNTGGRTYRVIIDREYTAPNAYFTWRYRVEIPNGNTRNIRFYFSMDSYVAGGDSGDVGYYNNNPSQTAGIYDNNANVLSAQRYINGPIWSGYEASAYGNMLTRINNNQNYNGTIQSTAGDLGYGINRNFGTAGGIVYEGANEWRMLPFVNTPTYDIYPSIGQPEPTLTVGQNSLITINIINAGTINATGNTTVNFTIPNNFTGPTSTFTTNGWNCGAVVGTTVTCTKTINISSLGGVDTLQIPLKPLSAAGGTTVNFSTSLSNSGDSNTTNNSATISQQVAVAPAPITITTITNNNWGTGFCYSFNIQNTSTNDITNRVIGFQLDNGIITSSWNGNFSNVSNQYEVRSNSISTDKLSPGENIEIGFCGSGNGIVSNLHLKSFTPVSGGNLQNYTIEQNGLRANITTSSEWNGGYCRNILLTNIGSSTINNWQLFFELDQEINSTSSATFNKNGVTFTINPLSWNQQLLPGATTNVGFCTNGVNVDNQWSFGTINIGSSDSNPPIINSNTPTNEQYITNGNFNFIFNYSDNIGINTNSDNIYLYKWDGFNWGSDISNSKIFKTSKVISQTQALYPSNNITIGRYKVVFNISDSSGNMGSITVIFNIGTGPSDSTTPNINIVFPGNNIIYPNASLNVTINYNDSDSGINSSSRVFELRKWNGSSWGPNIASSFINSNTANLTTANYNLNALGYGRYKIYFYIQDNAGNGNFREREFYIDEPELNVSTGNINIGNISTPGVNNFSPNVILTVRTVGTPFNLILNKDGNLTHNSIQIQNWNGVNGVGYEKTPFTNNINLINNNEIIATQATNLNTSGEKNTYIYTIRLGTNITQEQVAGSYLGNIKFSLELDY